MKKITLIKRRMIPILFFLLFTGIGFAQSQLFTASNTTQEFQVPAGVTSITVEAWGGGGKGGTRTTNGRGGGGGGGAYAKRVYTVSPGTKFPVKVGFGATTTTAGQSSWFIDQTSANVLAVGGSSVPNDNSNVFGGGAASNCYGAVRYSGANGSVAGTYGGAGGSSAGSTGAGVVGTNQTPASIIPTDAGKGGFGSTSNNGVATAGETPGGGGGGAFKNGSNTRLGGNGGNGQVVVTWYIPEINIVGNAVSIADPDTTPSLADDTHFGTIDLALSVAKTYTIENLGTADLTISGINFTGTNPGDFSVISAPATTVGPDNSTTFTVLFNPNAIGTRTAVMNIISNDYDEGSYNITIQGVVTNSEINVQGNNTNIVSGDTTPMLGDFTDFGSISANSGTVVRSFTIQNLNSATTALVVGTISIFGDHASDFTVTSAPAASVAVNGTTTFQITFNPSATGMRRATISIPNNDGNENPYTFSIQGTGNDPEMDVFGNSVEITDGDNSPSLLDFTVLGTTDILTGLITRVFTIENNGNQTLTIGAITLSGIHAADYAVTQALASSLAPGASTSFTVTFNPSVIGSRFAAISIVNNDPNENPYNFSIQGTGGNPEINLKGNGTTILDKDFSPTTGDHTNFGSAIVNGGTITRTFTIENLSSGTTPLNVGAITISGTGAGDYSIGTFPASTVAINSNTTFTVVFDPSVTGVRAATIRIINNDSNENPYEFGITGTGIEPEINLLGNGNNIISGATTASLTNFTDFGTTDIAFGTVSRIFTIQNKNTPAVLSIIDGAVISGANASEFTITTTPAASVAGNGSTTLGITFNPNSLGLKTALVTIANNDTDEDPYTFVIQGNGGDPEISIEGNNLLIADETTTTSLANGTDFGTTDIAAGSISKTFVIRNSNTATMNLTIGAITFSGANSSDFNVTTAPASSIAPGSSSSMVVTFDPSANGTRTATINIVNNDANENPYNFAISGSGTSPQMDVQGNGMSIADGDTTPDLDDWTNFGPTNTTNGLTTKVFAIHNLPTASLPLAIGTATITGTNAADFTITALPASTVAIGGFTTIAITFNPSANGNRTATLTIQNNDSSKSPYNFSISGTGTNPEINLVGNGVNIVSGDTTPSISDLTNFGSVSIDSGSTLVTFTIQNTAASPNSLNVGNITFTGPDASSFSIFSAPNPLILGASSSSFTVSFAPTVPGTKSATINIVNDDTNENPYTFAITGLGVRTYSDTDGDGISDNIDIDDDNDGIIDIYEQNNCLGLPFSQSVEYVFLNETFGTGTTKGLININIPGATCTYCFEDGIEGPNTTECPRQSSKILDDGEYVVTHKIAGTDAADPDNIHGDLAWNGLEDHTPGDINGRMAVFNADFIPGIFYETTVKGILPNVPVTYSFWALNIMSSHTYPNSILPNITVEFLDVNGVILSTFNTGDIGRCNGGTGVNTCAYSEWQQYTTSANLGNNSTFIIRFKNNAPGGGGNDLALDDITIKQQYCDRDGDGVANIFDLDSDNDGIPDIEEAGFKHLSAGRGIMDMVTPGVWVDANMNGLHDEIDAMIAAGTYLLPDTDGDGINDIIDLDSDNDSIFDVDESGLYNGDGDIDGDGFGDGGDIDKDGFLDIFDTFFGQGTAVRPYANDTDNNGIPDYMQIDSNSDGINDIMETLYAAWDANGDGKIDGTADIDKDGIIDTFDTSTVALGSPRDLNRKLFLDFDGRNDYGQATQLLSNLPNATMMAWIKLTAPFTHTGMVIGQDNFNLKVVTGSGNRLTATAKGQTVSFGTSLEENRWYHIAAIYSGTNKKLELFVNGNKVDSLATSTLSGTLATSAAKFTFGKNATASTEYFKGAIDEVRIFNTNISEDQLHKMVYQEIKLNGAAIRGEIVPRNIESSSWSNLIGYYRMDAYKGDVIDNFTSPAIDQGASTALTRIYNVKNIKYQLAPMPFVTTQSGALDAAVSQNNFVHGLDVLTNDWTIVKIQHDINLSDNLSGVGLFVDAGKNVILNNNNAVKNSWYLKLDGRMDLQGRSQLAQTGISELDPTSSGHIERDQQGTVNKFNYNYWSSPVGTINSSTNNTSYTVNGVMRDGTNPANPQNINWTTGLNSAATSPVTLSNYWIFKFQNVTPIYANWAAVGQTGALLAGQGFTLKGSSATTPTQNYTFIGKPNSGPISSPIAANNMNLSGNPYPSAIDANKFITDNAASLDGSIYFWEHFNTNTTHTLVAYQGGYATYTKAGGTPPISPSGISGLGSSERTAKRFIPVGQGFFVTGSATGGNIVFNNGQRAFIKEDNVASNIMFKQNQPLMLNSLQAVPNNFEDTYQSDAYTRIRLGFNSRNNFHRQILLAFMDDEATAGIDKGYDALNMDDQPNDMSFFRNAGTYNILGEGQFNIGDIFPLAVKTTGQGLVSFTLDATEHFQESQPIYIHDNVTGIYHNIRAEKFEINLPTGNITNRFSLRFTNGTLGTDSVDFENQILVAFTNANNILNVRNNIIDANAETVMLYNMLGQAIHSWDVENEDQKDIQIPVKNLSAGTYIVKIKTTKGDISKKIAIK